MLRMRLLGSFDLRGPGDRPLKVTARKTRALLAFLALQDGAPQTRERLAALLWEDADAELARSSLRQALTALRRALPAKLHALVEADAQHVALNLAQVQVDVHELRALLADATVESLQAARKLGAEPLLEGFDARSGAFEEWAAAERRTLRRDLTAAAAKLAALCRDAGDTDGEIDASNWLLTLEPLAEGAHRELMACYARAGRYTEALRQYQLLPNRAAPRARSRARSCDRGALSRPHEEAPRRRERAAVRVARRRARRRSRIRARRRRACARRQRRSRAADGRRARDAPARPRPRSGAHSTPRRRANSRSACSGSSTRRPRCTAALPTGSRAIGWSRSSASRTSRATNRSGHCAPRRRSSTRSARATSRRVRRRPASRRARCCRRASTGRSRSRVTR